MASMVFSLAFLTLGLVEYWFWVQLGVGHIEGALLSRFVLFKNPGLALMLILFGLATGKELRHVIQTELLSRVPAFENNNLRIGCKVGGYAAIAASVYIFYTFIPSFSAGYFVEEDKQTGFALLFLPLAANFVLLNVPSKPTLVEAQANTNYLRRK